MATTERKAVALDSAVDLLYILYDISDIKPVKPLKWLRGEIKTERSTKTTVEVAIEFWLFGDPNDKLDALVTLNHQHVFGETFVWIPKTATIKTKESESKWIYENNKWRLTDS